MIPKIYMAPMSGVTDLAFRLIAREFGAKHCFFEMLDAKATIFNHPKNRRLLKTLKTDSPISAQLVGADPEAILEAAQKLLSIADIDSVDINSACPAKKVIKKGAGAALLKDVPRLGKMVKKLTDNLRVPVSVKLRAGFHKRNVAESVNTARVCEENGASTVYIHGRATSQGYAGDVDYESIREVKKALRIPVFGSGNIFNAGMARRMLEETECDGILVARGALGNPWIFKEIDSYLKNGKTLKSPGLTTKKKVLEKHLAYIEKYKDISPANKIGLMGKVAMWYLKGLENASQVRARICRIRSYRELLRLINTI